MWLTQTLRSFREIQVHVHLLTLKSASIWQVTQHGLYIVKFKYVLKTHLFYISVIFVISLQICYIKILLRVPLNDYYWEHFIQFTLLEVLLVLLVFMCQSLCFPSWLVVGVLRLGNIYGHIRMSTEFCETSSSCRLYSVSPLGDQATSTITWYPTHLHYPDTEATSPCLFQ